MRSAPAENIAALKTLHAALSDLSALQPKILDLRRLIATAELQQAAQLARLQRLDEARRVAGRVATTLHTLRTGAPADELVRNALVDALLFQAELEKQGGMPARALAACQAAADILRPVHQTHDFNVPAPWVLAHRCTGKDNLVSQQRELLTKMAYRDANYTRRIQSQPST